MKLKNKVTLTSLTYIITATILIFLCACVFAFFRAEKISNDIAYQNAGRDAQRYAKTLKIVRSLYTSEVIAQVQKSNGVVKVTHDYKNPAYDTTCAIPLPATLSMLLAEKMTDDQRTVKLYSKYPFPWRKGRTLTEFEERAFKHFEINRDSDVAFYEEDKVNQVVRYAIPDKMVSMTCVNCHNNHPQSPKTGWKLGDVRGAISIIKPVNSASIVKGSTGALALIVLIAVIVLIGLWVTIVHIKSVRGSIDSVTSRINEMKSGNLVDHQIDINENEMKEVVQGLNVLHNNFKNITAFAESIGKGQLNTEFKRLSDEDSLGMALIAMRDNLRRLALEDERRNWVAAGLSQLDEILRRNQNDAGELYDRIIHFIVKYTGSNQGGLFLLEEEGDARFLELKSCYAYERKKFVDSRLQIGEGIIGQCFLDQDLIHLTEIPRNFAKITSGLGEALPNTLLVVPLKINDGVCGVVEMLSFKKYDQHEIDFMSKGSESIASTISIVKVNERTHQLLRTQQQHN